MSREEFSEHLAALSRVARHLGLPAHQVILHQLAASSADPSFATSLAQHVSSWNGLGVAMDRVVEVEADLFPQEIDGD